jgi:hypothetical protein
VVAITDKQRHHLFTRLEEALGPDEAATLMDMLPPVGWADVATKHDLAALERRLDQRIDGLEQRIDLRIDGLEQRIDLRIDGLEQRFDQRIDGLEQRFDQRIDGLVARIDGLDQVFVTKAELHAQTRTFITWTLTSQATLVAVVALLVSMT